ncbi:hypothetical protein [Pseudacidovorax sp. RU35E]|jgi:hypothetical protein|uniref:hypothetical protein n=1 Tax=Pseudacidovorax sp. RU35E TaxID=1907403 RepID=UPI00117B3611|nr:hypothetical protein [Pseudacidovorax sp. RU35E]
MLRHDRHRRMAGNGRRTVRNLTARLASMIRVDAVWLCVEPMDMRAGTDSRSPLGNSPNTGC